MFNSFFGGGTALPPRRKASQVLLTLDAAFDRESRVLLDAMPRLPTDSASIKSFARTLAFLGDGRAKLAQVRGTGLEVDPSAAREVVHGLATLTLRTLRQETWPHFQPPQSLGRLLHQLQVVGIDLAALPVPLTLSRSVERPAGTGAARHILIAPDVLFQAHHGLFPAERMLVASGRRTGDKTELGALFDVTGEHHAVHVQADPALLARALIAMELSGTHLACWIHSHPGVGADATHPSAIDHRQHADWIRDYTPALLGIIIVRDGWIRLWGTAIEKGTALVDVTGPGVTRESNDGDLYRLAY